MPERAAEIRIRCASVESAGRPNPGWASACGGCPVSLRPTLTLYIVWAVVILGEILLLTILVVRRRDRTFPVFTGYSLLLVVKSLVLLYCSFHDDHDGYFYAFYATSLVESVVVLAVIAEVFNKVFAPKRLLTREICFKIKAAYVIVLLTFVSLSMSNLYAHPVQVMRLARFTDRVTTFILFGSFALLCALSRYLMISWRKHAFGIGAGFIITLSINAVCTALLSWVSWGAASQIRYVRMSGFLVALLIWSSYFWKNEPELLPVSKEIVVDVLRTLRMIDRSIANRNTVHS